MPALRPVNARPPKRRTPLAGGPEGVTGLAIRRRPPPTQGLAPESFAAPHGARSPEIAHAMRGDSGARTALSTSQADCRRSRFFCSPEMGRLAAKEPASVKRLVTFYRIVRARMGEAAVSALLGQRTRSSYSLLRHTCGDRNGQSRWRLRKFLPRFEAK